MTGRKVRLSDRRQRTVIYYTLASMMIVKFYGIDKRNCGKNITSVDDATAMANKAF